MKLVVGMADLKVTKGAEDELITYALGSCLGISLWDPVAKVGGLLHVMMPESSIDPAKAKDKPYMFVDTGVPQLFKQCYALGAVKQRVIVKVAGGASTQASQGDYFQIGKRNFTFLRKLLWKNGVMLKCQDVGGRVSRTMSLNVGTGEVLLKINGETNTL